MVIENVIGNINDFDIGQRKIDKVFFEWYELEKKLLRKTSESGTELGIRINTSMKDGDVLYADDESIIIVELLPAELTVVTVDSMKAMGRLCFELGNRHLSLSIGENQVSIIYDEPTFLYLEKLGFNPQRITDKFVNVTACHAHGHHEHNHEHEHNHHEHEN